MKRKKGSEQLLTLFQETEAIFKWNLANVIGSKQKENVVK